MFIDYNNFINFSNWLIFSSGFILLNLCCLFSLVLICTNLSLWGNNCSINGCIVCLDSGFNGLDYLRLNLYDACSWSKANCVSSAISSISAGSSISSISNNGSISCISCISCISHISTVIFSLFNWLGLLFHNCCCIWLDRFGLNNSSLFDYNCLVFFTLFSCLHRCSISLSNWFFTWMNDCSLSYDDCLSILLCLNTCLLTWWNHKSSVWCGLLLIIHRSSVSSFSWWKLERSIS